MRWLKRRDFGMVSCRKNLAMVGRTSWKKNQELWNFKTQIKGTSGEHLKFSLETLKFKELEIQKLRESKFPDRNSATHLTISFCSWATSALNS